LIPKGSGQAGSREVKIRDLAIRHLIFAFSRLPISLQTDTKTYNQTLEVFAGNGMISVLEKER
jgi:hypothetical protein